MYNAENFSELNFRDEKVKRARARDRVRPKRAGTHVRGVYKAALS